MFRRRDTRSPTRTCAKCQSMFRSKERGTLQPGGASHWRTGPACAIERMSNFAHRCWPVNCILDEGFHETGGHGTGGELMDSSFVVDRTRSDIMAGWRQAIELAMSDEEAGKLAVIARSGSEAARRVKRARMLLGYRETPSFFAVGQRLGAHHQTVQRCIERALADGPLAALDDRPRPGKEPTITPEAQAQAGCSWRGQGGSMAIRTSCARHAFLHATPASTRRAADTDALPIWSKARCARSSVKRRSSRTRFATTWNAVMRTSSRRWRRFCVFIARSRS